jgi:hypothetical protein
MLAVFHIFIRIVGLDISLQGAVVQDPMRIVLSIRSRLYMSILTTAGK